MHLRLKGKKMKFFLGLLLSSITPFALASDSLVRIDCQNDTDGAAVFIDGEYQFDCENYAKLPVLVSAGEHELRVVRPIGKEFEQVFVKQLQLQAGVPQRVRVSLPGKTLTAYGQKQEALRQEEARAAADKANEARREQARIAATKAAEAQLEKDRTSARAGDVEAMKRLAVRYRSGDGVPADSQTAAARWAKPDSLVARAANKR
jgi:hypothetical protein